MAANNIYLYDYNGIPAYPYVQLSGIKIDEWDNSVTTVKDFPLYNYIKTCINDQSLNVVDLTTNQTINGVKTFTSKIIGSIENADNATSDGDGNIIKNTYATKNEIKNFVNIDNFNKSINDLSTRIDNLSNNDNGTIDLSNYNGDVSIKVKNYFNVNGNVTIDGSIAAKDGFYQTSDERLKTFKNPININLDELSNIKKFIFAFNDDLTNDHIGVSAQEIQKLYPEIVSMDINGILKVDYSKLSVIALAAIDKLYQDNIKLNNRLKELESKIKIVKYKN